MFVEPKLKPLLANLKRVQIGKYLSTRDFELFVLENNLDVLWEKCKNEVDGQHSIIIAGYHNTEDEEDAFMYLISYLYFNNYNNFHKFILPMLLNFAKWNKTKLDFTPIIENLKQISISKENILKFSDEIRNIQETKPDKSENNTIGSRKIHKKPMNSMKVFIVHGHDDEAKIKTARFIEKLGFQPIILHEQASSGRTIIEKIEEYSNVDFGIVLYTACDLGGKRTENPALRNRARQNVVFEHGFLIGKIGRDNVCALVKGDIETPNDISGVVYILMDDADAWHVKIAKELKNSGYPVDMNKIF